MNIYRLLTTFQDDTFAFTVHETDSSGVYTKHLDVLSWISVWMGFTFDEAVIFSGNPTLPTSNDRRTILDWSQYLPGRSFWRCLRRSTFGSNGQKMDHGYVLCTTDRIMDYYYVCNRCLSLLHREVLGWIRWRRFICG